MNRTVKLGCMLAAASMLVTAADEQKPAKYVVGSGCDATVASAQKTEPAKAQPAAQKTGTEKTQPAAQKAGDTLVVSARLVELPGKFPPNDLYNYVYVMKYRILKVENGTYAGPEILVGQYNPLIPRKNVKDKMDPLVNGDVEKFEVGGKHRLTLVSPIEKAWNDAVEDGYFDSEMEKYFAVKTETIK